MRPALLLFAAAALVVLSGCRTYGHYGSEEALRTALTEATEAFAVELTQRRADADALAQLAARQPALAPYAEQYQNAVLAHDAVLGEARAHAEQLQGSGSHRGLKRAYGALVMSQASIHRQYQSILEAIAADADTASATQPYYDPQSRYFIVPPFYERLAGARTISLQEAVRGVQPGPGAGQAVPPTGPGGATTSDTTAAEAPAPTTNE